MDFVGVAAIMTAFTGLVSVVLTAVVILKTSHIVKLTNSNHTALQAALNTALAENVKQQDHAVQAAKESQRLTSQVVQAAVGKTVEQVKQVVEANGPPVPVIVENITADVIETDTLNVTTSQAEGIAEAVVEAVEKGKADG